MTVTLYVHPEHIHTQPDNNTKPLDNVPLSELNSEYKCMVEYTAVTTYYQYSHAVVWYSGCHE